FQKHINIDSISLIGGGAQGDVWSQILSDIFNIRVSKPKYLTEATSLGAAVIGGVGVGEFNDFGIVKQFNSIQSEQRPNMQNVDLYKKMYNVFNHSYDALFDIYEQL